MQPMQMCLHADMQQIDKQQLDVDCLHRNTNDQKRSKVQEQHKQQPENIVPHIFDAAPYRQAAKAYCLQGCACVCMPESVCPYHFLAYNFTAKVESAIRF